MGDYDAFALQDEFGDDLDDIATEIAVLRRENARLRATIDNQSAEIGRLRAERDGLAAQLAEWERVREQVTARRDRHRGRTTTVDPGRVTWFEHTAAQAALSDVLALLPSEPQPAADPGQPDPERGGNP